MPDDYGNSEPQKVAKKRHGNQEQGLENTKNNQRQGQHKADQGTDGAGTFVF